MPYRSLLVLVVASILAWPAPAAQKKEEEEITQTREVFEDPPYVVTADTTRLTYITSPLSGKGLLSQQARDALKHLLRQAKGSIVKVRALVAGTGDLRRVQAILSEMFADKRLPVPALSVVQVGALPLEGAQVIMEAAVVLKKLPKKVTQNGVAFLSGQAVQSGEPDSASRLVGESVARLQKVSRAAGVQPQDVLRVTCFVSSLKDWTVGRSEAAKVFANAAVTYVQLQRGHLQGLAECEAAARIAKPVEGGVKFVNAPDLPVSPNYSHAVLVSTPKLALSGLRMAFQDQESDARLAFQRLEKDLDQAHSSAKAVVMSNLYPLSGNIQQLASKVRFEFYDRTKPPASTMLVFEGLPSLDASFGIEVVAVSTAP